MRGVALGAPIGAAIAAFSFSTLIAHQDDKVVPVHQEPRHRLVFDSPGTRILDVQIPPGDTTLFHTHSDAILYVTMSTSQTRSQNLGAEWSGGATPPPAPSTSARTPPFVPAAAAGSDSALPGADSTPAVGGSPRVVPSSPAGRMMSTTSYNVTPQTHRVNNIGSSLFRLIGITNSSPGDESTTPSADFTIKPEVDNRWFRGYRWMLGPEPSSQHRHVNAVAVVLVSGKATADVAGTSKALDSAGSFVFIEPGTAHQLRGAGADAQVVEVEIRRVRGR